METPARKALGMISTSGTASRIAEILVNNTGQNLTSFSLSYTGEEWWSNSTSAQSMSFAYVLDGTTLSGGTIVAGLGFTAPVVGNGTGTAMTGARGRTRRQSAATSRSLPAPGHPAKRWSFTGIRAPAQAAQAGLAISNVAFTGAGHHQAGDPQQRHQRLLVGVSSSFSVTATNSPTSFTETGTIPSWMSFNTTSGVMTFTSPTAVATTTNYTFTIAGVNANGTGVRRPSR